MRERQSRAVRELAGMHIRAAADEGKSSGPDAWAERVKASVRRWSDAEVDAAIAAAAEEER